MENQIVKITKLERKLLSILEHADHTSDGHGICGYIFHDEHDMRVLRGVMTSLQKKGVIGVDLVDPNFEPHTWCYVTSNFQIENPLNKWGGMDLTNLEVIE